MIAVRSQCHHSIWNPAFSYSKLSRILKRVYEQTLKRDRRRKCLSRLLAK
ncbi:hypothetical protein Hanom_Chr06g00541231 [Helianthus anomalus]